MVGQNGVLCFSRLFEVCIVAPCVAYHTDIPVKNKLAGWNFCVVSYPYFILKANTRVGPLRVTITITVLQDTIYLIFVEYASLRCDIGR